MSTKGPVERFPGICGQLIGWSNGLLDGSRMKQPLAASIIEAAIAVSAEITSNQFRKSSEPDFNCCLSFLEGLMAIEARERSRLDNLNAKLFDVCGRHVEALRNVIDAVIDMPSNEARSNDALVLIGEVIVALHYILGDVLHATDIDAAIARLGAL